MRRSTTTTTIATTITTSAVDVDSDCSVGFGFVLFDFYFFGALRVGSFIHNEKFFEQLNELHFCSLGRITAQYTTPALAEEQQLSSRRNSRPSRTLIGDPNSLAIYINQLQICSTVQMQCRCASVTASASERFEEVGAASSSSSSRSTSDGSCSTGGKVGQGQQSCSQSQRVSA